MDIMEIIVYTLFIATMIIFVYGIRNYYFTNKYIAVFCLKENDGYNIVKKKKIKPTVDSITYKSHTIKPFNINDYTYKKKLKRFYFIDINNSQLLFQTTGKAILTTKEIDMYFRRNLISQLATNLLGTKYTIPIMLIIVGAVIGFLIGFIVSGGKIG